jgi:hypothetical protein
MRRCKMPNEFLKGPGYEQPGKKKKRIMKEFTISEISGVDFGAQAGARVVIMKRDDSAPVEKLIVLTSSDVGHQHSVDIDGWTIRNSGGSTSYGYSEGSDEEHQHQYVIDSVTGSVTVGESQGHSHTVDITSTLQRLALNNAVQGDSAVIQMRSPLVKSESGKEFGLSDFAYIPDPNSPDTWQMRLSGSPGGNPDRRLVGNAVEALKRLKVPEDERTSVIRRVRTAWLKAHKSKSFIDMPSVLKPVSL